MDDLIELMNDDWNDKSRVKADADFWKDVNSHPAFVNDVELNPATLSSDMEAMQAIKFDSEDLGENVLNYKNEGNHYYNKKTYTLALVNYTKGLKMNVNDNEMNCILYTNRAACHFHQENYRKCINDCKSAIKMNPMYLKAYWRAAHAAAKIDKCDEVLEYCEKGLKVVPNNKDLLSLKEKFTERKIQKDAANKLQLKSPQAIILEDTLKKRGVIVEEEMNSVEIPLQHLTPAFVDKDGLIHFNVLILYPEYAQTDFLQDVLETASILDCMRSIFQPREKSVDWDLQGHYTIFTADFQMALQSFYENAYQEMVRFNMKSPIRDLIQMKQFRLRADMVVEINIVSVLSNEFLTNWKKITSPTDLD